MNIAFNMMNGNSFYSLRKYQKVVVNDTISTLNCFTLLLVVILVYSENF